MGTALLSCLGLGVAAAAATGGAAHLGADSSLAFAAGSVLGGVAGNLSTDLLKALNRSVAQRWLEGRSGIDENHHVVHSLRLAQLQALKEVLRRFDTVWPGDGQSNRRKIARDFSESLRSFLERETAVAGKPGFAGAHHSETDEQRMRSRIISALPAALDKSLAVRRIDKTVPDPAAANSVLIEAQRQIQRMVEQGVIAELELSVLAPTQELPRAFEAAFEGTGFADSWFDLFVKDAAARLVSDASFSAIWANERAALSASLIEAIQTATDDTNKRVRHIEEQQSNISETLDEMLRIARSGGLIIGERETAPNLKTALYMIVSSPVEAYGPLLEASILARDIPAISLLLSRGANPHDQTVEYGSPLELLVCEHEAYEANTVCNMIEVFLDHGADVNQLCEHGTSLLSWLIAGDKAVVCQFLIDVGANVNFKNRDGQTALMEAAHWGSSGCFDAILDSRPDINIQDNAGMTALMHVCAPQDFYAENEDYAEREALAVKFAGSLIRGGANVWMADANGKQAVDHALEQDLRVVERCIRQAMLDGGPFSQDGQHS